MSTFLKTRLVTRDEWREAHRKTGSVYFIRNDEIDTVKIGHSFDPLRRLSQLQVGNSSRLRLVGCIAAAIEIEARVHANFPDGRAGGEWFYDRGVISQWLMDMTQGEPMCRHVWEFVEGREWFATWDAESKTHTRHYWNPDTRMWEPPIK